MYLLTFDSFTLPVMDFVLDGDLYCLDLNFESKERFNQFDSFYQQHIEDAFSFNYKLDNNEHFGRFGALVYDLKYNVRLYMTTVPTGSFNFSNSDVLHHNLPKVLNNHEKRITVLIEILCKKGILTSDELTSLSSYLPQTNYQIDLKRQVENLNDYLTKTDSTLDSIRSNLRD